MEFQLLVPNHRQKWLPWFFAAVFVGLVLFLSSAPGLVFTLLIGGVVVACIAGFFPKFGEHLFWQPMPVWLAADGVAWLKPDANEPVKYLFSTLQAYRFVNGRGNIYLVIWLLNGEKITLRCHYSVEFDSFQQTFMQTIRAHNQLSPSAQIMAAEEPITKFFKSPVSTSVLFGLLAVLALWVCWSVAHGLHLAVYIVPTLLVLLPYLLIWANFYYQRR